MLRFSCPSGPVRGRDPSSRSSRFGLRRFGLRRFAGFQAGSSEVSPPFLSFWFCRRWSMKPDPAGRARSSPVDRLSPCRHPRPQHQGAPSTRTDPTQPRLESRSRKTAGSKLKTGRKNWPPRCSRDREPPDGEDAHRCRHQLMSRSRPAHFFQVPTFRRLNPPDAPLRQRKRARTIALRMTIALLGRGFRLGGSGPPARAITAA